MKLDPDKIDEAALAMLYLTLHDVSEHGGRAWKGLDWEALDRLHAKGLISDPKSKTKSVTLGPQDIAKAKAAALKLFGDGR